MASERTSERAFFGVSALLFAAGAAATIVWCASMAAMPGGWTKSMAWMRMPGQTWSGSSCAGWTAVGSRENRHPAGRMGNSAEIQLAFS